MVRVGAENAGLRLNDSVRVRCQSLRLGVGVGKFGVDQVGRQLHAAGKMGARPTRKHGTAGTSGWGAVSSGWVDGILQAINQERTGRLPSRLVYTQLGDRGKHDGKGWGIEVAKGVQRGLCRRGNIGAIAAKGAKSCKREQRLRVLGRGRCTAA